MTPASTTRQRLFTGIASVLILALAFWLFLGRSPSGGPERVEADWGGTVATDRGTVTVRRLEAVDEGSAGVPKAGAGHVVDAIRFRSCRTDPDGTVVDLSLFSVVLGNGTSVAAEGSKLSETTGGCVSGQAFVQLPVGSTETAIEYAADPVGVWRVPQD
jgi:hypothetical protein